jgi:hypothetical protein
MSNSITLVTDSYGSVHGHKAGCADIAKQVKKQHMSLEESTWTFDVDTKHEAWVNYNSDFLGEGSGAYDIEWKACANHIEQGAEDTEEAWENESLAETNLWTVTVETTKELVESPEVVTTFKKGAKWTYVYVDGTLVAEIRNDQAHLIAAAVGH